MFDKTELPITVRARRSDVYFQALAGNGLLKNLLSYLLPGRVSKSRFSDVTNHDKRAALICALTALCISGDSYSAVGDIQNGWIILPPHSFIKPWADRILMENGNDDGSYGHS
jgi:hypothetical protein